LWMRDHPALAAAKERTPQHMQLEALLADWCS